MKRMRLQIAKANAERLDCGDFSAAFGRDGKLEAAANDYGKTAVLKPPQSRRVATIPATLFFHQ